MSVAELQALDHWVELYKNAEHILLVGHTSPDGDAVGSVSAMAGLLRKEGKKVSAYVPDPFPDFLLSVPGAQSLKIYDEDPKAGNEDILSSDLIVCMDFNRIGRSGTMAQMLGQRDVPKVLIDHHLHPADGFAVLFSDTQRSSTCELVYHIIESTGKKAHIDADIAQAIYTGLVTDTGSFKYNTRESTHAIAAELIATGLDSAKIHGELFDTQAYSRLQLLGYALSQKLRYFPDKGASFFTLTAEELKRFDYKKGDTEGLVNYGLSIAGTRFTALASEKDGVVKISFRSKGDLDVNVIAREHFGGGGHKNAAGARSESSLEEVEQIIRSIIEGL